MDTTPIDYIKWEDQLDEISDQDTTDDEMYYKCNYRWQDIKPLAKFPLYKDR